jgi:glycine/D-amino acid oxidase-like deaminating enzyme
MVEHADVVVVGGGIMGCAVALHLLEAGAESVSLIERAELFQGTTGAGGGFLAPWTVMNPMHGAASPALPAERYGLDFYAGLHEAGHDIGYRRNGLLWIAADESALADIRAMPWSAADPDSAAVAPEELPGYTGGALSAEGVAGAWWLPSAAQVEVGKLGEVLARLIRARGGTIETGRAVRSILVRGGLAVGVETSAGPVHAEAVVLAAGAWNNALLEPLGFHLAAVPQVTSRIVTAPLGIAPSLPLLMLQGLLPDEPNGGTVLWVRSREGGLLWGGMYTCHPRNALVGRAVPDRLDELPLDGVFENQRTARAARFMPALSRPASITVRHGAPCYSPDDRELVGPVPAVPGLHVMGGDNELGVTHGPGLAKALAELITTGRSEVMDLEPFRPDRFGRRYPDDAATLAGVGLAFGQILAGGAPARIDGAAR